MKRLNLSSVPKSLVIILLAYLCTRLFNLTVLPMFTDESIYIYWAKVIQSTQAQFFISLTDGKPPLLIWMIASFLTILPDHWYLIAGRLPSVIAGFVATIMIFSVTETLFRNRWMSILAAVLYVIFPYTLLYDRMALFDSLLQASLLAAVYFAVKTAQYLQWRYAVSWGISMGVAYLSKPTALLFIVLLPVIVVVIHSGLKHRKWKRVAMLSVAATVIGEGINNLQRISSVYEFMGRKNAQFQQPIEELLKNPFALTIGNLKGFAGWIVDYYTIPFVLVGIVGIILLLRKNWRFGVSLLLLYLTPLVGLATIGREIFPRYILFTTPYFLIVASFCIVVILQSYSKYKYVLYIGMILIIIPLLRTDVLLLTKPESADLPSTDYQQYVSLHPSGYGIDRIYDFINQKINSGQSINLVTQGTFGLYPYAFTLEYWNVDRVTVIPKWPLDVIDDEIIAATREKKTYILLKEHEDIPQNMPLRLILKSEKPGGMNPLLLTEIADSK